MSPTWRLTLLVDTRARREGLRTEPGFSLWVEGGGQSLLLDTGTSEAFLSNLDGLGLGTTPADTLLLSHGHVDHAGGLPAALSRWPGVRVVLHPAAEAPRWSLYRDHPPRALGFPQRSQRALAAHGGPVLRTPGPIDLGEGIRLLHAPPRLHAEEARSGPFYLDPEGTVADPFSDELTLALHTADGLVVVLGCCHLGVINTLDHALACTGAPRIRAVVGGLHLAKAGKERLAWTAAQLRRLGSPALHLCHCTGAQACEALPHVVQGMIAGDAASFG